jgi:hypothetical protein
VPTNLGYQLERLDPATGKHLWPAARRLSKMAWTTAAFDATAVYYAVGQELQARSLSDGKRLWVRLLPSPAGCWQVLCTSTFVAAYPVPSLARIWNAGCRLPVVLPLGFSQVALPMPASFVDGKNSGFCVLLFDHQDGRLLQRLNFATAWPWATVQSFAQRLVVAGDGRGWGLVGGSN